MADDTENLAITITAADSGATGVLTDIQFRIAEIERELNSASQAGSKFGGQLSGNLQQAGQHAGTVGGMFRALGDDTKSTAGAFDELTQHSYLIARGLDAANLAGGAAVTRIGALSDALRGLIAANPEIMAVVAAIAVMVGTFEEFKKGAELASEFQQSMIELKNAVQEQGGDWAAAQASVEAWTSAMANAAGVTDTDAVGALNKLVEAGASWKDAEAELTVGAQMVAAGMGDWATVTRALYEAQSGEGMMLGRLDPAVRNLIKSHADLQTVMEAIAKQTAQSITNDDTLAAAHARLHAVSDELSKEFGNSLLPALTYIEKGMIGVNIATAETSNGIDGMIRAIVKAVATGAAELEHFVHGLLDLKTGNLKDAADQFQEMAHQQTLLGHSFTEFESSFNQATHGVVDGFHLQTASAAAYNKAIKALADSLKNLGHLSHNPTMDQTTGGGGSGFTPPVLNDAIDENRLETQAEQENERVTSALADAKDHAEVSEAALTAAMKASTTVAGEQSAQATLDTQKIADLADQRKILNDAIYTETRMLGADSAAHQEATVRYEAAKNALTSFTQAHAGEKNMAESDKETIVALRAAYQAAEQEMEKTGSVVKSLTNEIRQHREESARDAAAQIELASASRDAAASALRDWDKFFTAEQQKMADDAATANMSERQKVAYYAQGYAAELNLAQTHFAQLQELYAEDVAAAHAGDTAKVRSLQLAMAQMQTLIQQETDLAKQYYQDDYDAYKSMLQQEVDARKAVIDKEEQMTQTFLDDILTEHKSFGEEMKSILNSWVKDYIDAMSKMMFPTNAGTAPSSNPFAQFFSGFFGADSSQSGSLTTAGTTLHTAGISLQQAALDLKGVGGGSGGGILSQIQAVDTPTGPAIPTYAAGINADEYASDWASAGAGQSDFQLGPSGMMQIGTFGTPTSSDLLNIDPYAAIDQSIDGGIPLSQTNVGSTGTTSALQQAGSALQEALMGYMIGQSINQLENPNEMPGQSSGTWAGIGGAIGDVGGTMVAGPVGGMIGAILGSLIGGLFGSHETAAQMPDVSEPNYGTQWNYGQFVSNMEGTYGYYNGQYVQAQQGYNIYTGGTSMADQLTESLKDLPKNLSPVVEQLAGQLRALEEGDTNANALQIKSESQGMFTLESGATVSVQQYMQMVSQFMNATAGMVPTYTLSQRAGIVEGIKTDP